MKVSGWQFLRILHTASLCTFLCYFVNGHVRADLPILKTFRALEEVEKVPVEMQKFSTRTMDVTTDISALPLKPDVGSSIENRRFNVEMRWWMFEVVHDLRILA